MMAELAAASPANGASIPSRITSLDEWVKLNIGGTVFLTTKTTLCKEKNSFLARLCQDDPDLPSLKDEGGAYLVDRDPRYFPPILNFLRYGKLIVDSNLSEEGILEEAEFYNLTSLVQIVKARIHAHINHMDDQKSVYRVIHCQEGELTQMLSTLSDGWKMTQLVNIGSQYSYSSDDQSEFLVVVSRDFDTPSNASTKQTDKEKAMKRHGSRM